MAEVRARTVLWYLAFFGFAVNYMIRINVNITIVEMIKSKDRLAHLTKAELPVLFNSSNLNFTYVDLEAVSPKNGDDIIERTINDTMSLPARKYSLERQFLDWANIDYEMDGFDWNESQQGMALGSFFWLHWVLQIPGGILARKYGTKLVFGLSNAIGVWCCFLIPLVSYWDFNSFIFLRVFQGLVTGVAWPSMHVLTAKWIPPNDRSKFVTAYLGSSVGIAVFYPMFGYVMHWTSWEFVYHICGILGTTWYICWQYFVYDSPAEHPRIDPAECRYIEKSLGATVNQTSEGPTPWIAIMKSRPMWMNVVAQWGGIWGLFTLMTQAPTYFRVIHHWNIRATGWLSGLPHLMRMVFAYAYSVFSDYLLRTNRMSRTNVRKLATAICCIVKGFLVLSLAYFGYNSVAAIVLLSLATMFHGAVSSGPLAAVVDLAPNYAGIVLGFCGLIGGMPGFISPLVVGRLTLGNQTIDAWKNVFLIASGMLLSSGLLYVFYADATLQEWNSNENKSELVLKEIQSDTMIVRKEEENKPLKEHDKHDNDDS